MPLSELAVPNRVVGERQVRKALKDKNLEKLFVAEDANRKRIEPLIELAEESGIGVESVLSMQMLGRACAISRGASVAGVIKYKI